MNKIDQINKLKELLQAKVVSQSEYEKLKSDIVDSAGSSNEHQSPITDLTGGAANKMAELAWVNFIVRTILFIIALIFILPKIRGVFSAFPRV